MKSFKITESITNRSSETFKAYLKDIANIDMFGTSQEEADCATKAINGDEKALEELINRNLRFVVSVAKQYKRGDVQLEDLINEGNIGLFEAAKRYDPTTGYKFISYAVWYVRKHILEYLSTTSRIIRVPSNRINTLPKFNVEVEALRQMLGREVTDGDIYENLTQYSESEIRGLMELDDTLTSSLDTPFSTNGDSGTLLDIIEGPGNKPTDSNIVDAQSKDTLNKLLGTLKSNQEQVIRLYFGLGYEYGRNLDEIGSELGVSRERVRQIKEKGINHLRNKCSEVNIDMDIFG